MHAARELERHLLEQVLDAAVSFFLKPPGKIRTVDASGGPAGHFIHTRG